MERVPNALSFFSSITIHGLASSTTSDDSQPLVLSRDQSFPAKRIKAWCNEECLTETDSEWESLPVPVGKAHAEFELLEQLGEGRISIVYAARLLCIRQCPNGDIIAPDTMLYPLPDQFCVKLAKAEFIRSLAREAWFYEQLAKEDGYQGVITPVCFGFLTVPLPNTLEISDWSKIEAIPRKHDFELVYDRYDDDEEGEITEDSYTNDQRSYRDDCPGTVNKWIVRTDCSPIVGVLITERLGEHFPPMDLDSASWNQLSEETQPEILDLLDDLSAAGILHLDVKFNNFVRPVFVSSSPSSSQPQLSQICPRHNRIHAWRVIDFNRSYKWGKSVAEDVELFTRTQRTTFWFRYWGE